MKGTFFSYFSYRQLQVFRCRFTFTCSWWQHYPPFSPNVCLWEVGRRKGLRTRLLESMDVCLCAHLCEWVHVCVCLCVDSWMFDYVSVSVCVSAYVYVSACLCLCGSAFVRACVCLFVGAYLLKHMCLCVCVCMLIMIANISLKSGREVQAKSRH